MNGLGSIIGPAGAGGILPGKDAGDAGEAQGAGGFKAFFERALRDVNEQLVTADRLSEKLITGEVEDVSQVTIAAQKAELSLQLVIQMRNKLLEAYQEIMRMPV